MKLFPVFAVLLLLAACGQSDQEKGPTKDLYNTDKIKPTSEPGAW
ncbi:hypothetical protein OP500_07315 [Kingella sp. SNUBH-2017]|jgi:lipoprotein|nr:MULTISPECIES: hypothetical protein [Kingella]MDD2183115.1 hypothetical protein [Kingella sp. SNUBH-2017]